MYSTLQEENAMSSLTLEVNDEENVLMERVSRACGIKASTNNSALCMRYLSMCAWGGGGGGGGSQS